MVQYVLGNIFFAETLPVSSLRWHCSCGNVVCVSADTCCQVRTWSKHDLDREFKSRKIEAPTAEFEHTR